MYTFIPLELFMDHVHFGDFEQGPFIDDLWNDYGDYCWTVAKGKLWGGEWVMTEL